MSPLSRRLRLLSPILATLLLAALFAPPAQAGNNLNTAPAGKNQEAMGAPATEGNLHKEPVRDPSAKPRTTIRGTAEAAGNKQDAQNPPAQHPGWWYSDTPVAISCNIPGNPPRSILVPAGKNPMDFCPATAIAIHPQIANGPPPANWDSLNMEQDNIVRDELRALELRNKTSGQQTPEQKTSGQSP